MSRLAVLVAALAFFIAVPSVLRRLEAAGPAWRMSLSLLTLAGLFASSASLLAGILLPEVLVVRSLRDLWTTCAQAFRSLGNHPFGRLPSTVAGIALAVILARAGWSLVLGAVATRRARVRHGDARWSLAGGVPVYVLPVDHPEAYSLGLFRRQVVVSRGLVAALDEEERRAVLLHEEGHLRSRHHLLLRVARSAAAALEPLPAARSAIALLEQAVEEAADQYAASRLELATVASGVSTAALAGLRNPVGALSAAAGPDVPARVRRLLAPTAVPRWVPATCLLLVAVLLGLLAVTQAIAGLAVVAAAHHVVGFGAAAALCPVSR
jgi:Zn-dependent protease with chaperone function